MKKPDSGLCGLLVVDKPAGFTSFDVVAKLRGICGTRRIGHGGTLDPMATGVLPVFIGNTAKAVDLQPRQDKTYEATLLLGQRTDTGDITGEVLEQAEEVNISRQQLSGLLAAFVGEIVQVPPMYSAVKVDGKPLYKYAREGKTVERKERRVTIHSIEYLGEAGENRHSIRVHCSKGTYIRTLVEDIGAKLGVPATLAALRRTTAGVFSIEDTHTLEEIQAAKDEGRLESLLLDVGHVFREMPRLDVDDATLQRLLHGAKTYRYPGTPGRYGVYANGVFVGLATLSAEGELRGEKLFYNREG